MSVFFHNLKPIVAAALLTVLISLPVYGQGNGQEIGQEIGQDSALEGLYARLKSAEAGAAEGIVREIELEWQKSGSPAMDLLLRRGKEALQEDKPQVAIEHFSALIDHAPEFAEGWNGRATAFFRSGRYGLAMADLQHVLSLNPHQFKALYGLAVIFEQLGQDDAAYDAYDMVLRLHPTHEKAIEALKRLNRGVNGTEL